MEIAYAELLKSFRVQFIIHNFQEVEFPSLLILIMKTNEMHYFSNLFDKVLYMFRTGPLSIIRSISTLYTQQYMLVLFVSASGRQQN
jgi:hypothetical protein